MNKNEIKPAIKKTCFIIMPITIPGSMLRKYGDNEHFNHILKELFIPSIKKCNLEPIMPIAEGEEVIQGRIFKYLNSADLVLCDMSTLNPNVFLELGYRIGKNKLYSLIIDDVSGKPPSDIHIVNYYTYSKNALHIFNIKKEIRCLSDHIKSCLSSYDRKLSLGSFFDFKSQTTTADNFSEMKEYFPNITSSLKTLRKIANQEKPLKPVSLSKKAKPSKKDYSYWFKIGIQLDRNKHYKGAFNAFNRAIDLNPDDPSAWNYKALMLLNIYKFEEALTALNKSLQINSTVSNIWKAKALVEEQFLNRNTDALRSINKELKLYPNDVEALTIKGKILYKLNRYNEALAAIDKSITSFPHDSIPWNIKGEILYKQRQFNDALLAFNKALEITPNKFDILLNKGRTLITLKKDREALESFDASLKLKPDNPFALSAKAISLFTLKRNGEALITLNTITELYPQNAMIWYMCAGLLAIKKYKSISLKFLKKAINLNPNIKDKVIKDIVFKKLRDDQDFKKLMNEG